jgi:hypothetical protein
MAGGNVVHDFPEPWISAVLIAYQGKRLQSIADPSPTILERTC